MSFTKSVLNKNFTIHAEHGILGVTMDIQRISE